MIRLGVCTSPDRAAQAAAAGYDYIECALSPLATMSEEEFTAARDCVLASPIRAEAFNLMVPRAVPVVGPDVSQYCLRQYLDKTIPRAAAMGCRVIVFGSGHARKVPDGYCKQEAYDDIVAFLRTAGDRCAKFGITIAIEPLGAADCNILNSVAEAVWVTHRANHRAVKVLVDIYHAVRDNQSFHEIRAAGCLMAHTHVSHPVTRVFPLPGDGYDYWEFFRALKDIGYTGRMSVEGNTEDFDSDLPKAFALLRTLR